MSNFFTETNWLLIFSLVFGSAALAVLGDWVGSKYGKKRLSIFKLRPKHTSRLITALTGALIAVGILGVMSVFSQDVRTALFGMKYIQQQIYDLQYKLNQSQAIEENARISLDITGFELASMRNDRLILEHERDELETTIEIMREESDQLKRDLNSMRSESIALSANVLLFQDSFEAGMSEAEIKEEFEKFKQQVKIGLIEQIAKRTTFRLRDVEAEFNDDEERELIKILSSADSRYYVRALSLENNTYADDMKIKIKLVYGISEKIYDKGEIIYRKFFMVDRNSEDVLHLFLRELKNHAIAAGILPEPATNTVGILSGEEFFNAVELLNKINAPVIINAIASNDIYTEGPVRIEILFEE